MAAFGRRENHRAREHAETSVRHPACRGLGLQFPALSCQRHPSEVFAGDHGLKLNGASIALKYHGPAHTDGTTSRCCSPRPTSTACRRYLLERHLPLHRLFHRRQHQRDDQGLRETSLAMAKRRHHHHPRPWQARQPAGRAEGIRDMLVVIRDNVARLKREGRSPDEAVARPSPPRPLMRNGASSSSTPASSRGWSTRACDRWRAENAHDPPKALQAPHRPTRSVLQHHVKTLSTWDAR